MTKLSLIASLGTAALLALSTPAFADTATTDGVFGCDIDAVTGQATRTIEVQNGVAMTKSTAHISKAADNMTSIFNSAPVKAAYEAPKDGQLPLLPAVPSTPAVSAPALPISCPAGTKAAADGLSCMATSGYQF